MKTFLQFFFLTLSLLLSLSPLFDQTYNAGIGSGTLGNNNVHVSSYAGRISTGSYNSFLVAYADYYNMTGINNTFTGYQPGRNSTSSNNTFLGKGAGEKNSTGGINTFVDSEAGFNNTSGYHNVFIGRSTAQNNSSSYENTFLGNAAGFVNTTGYKNTALSYLSGPAANNLTNATAIGHRARVSVFNALVLGSIYGVNGAIATIRVAIGISSTGYLLHANGSAAKPGGGSWTAASDKRLKENIKDSTEALEI